MTTVLKLSRSCISVGKRPPAPKYCAAWGLDYFLLSGIRLRL